MDIGIVYHIETPQQFWAELEDILNVTHETSLAGVDYALKTFVEVCANNHERFLQANAQLDYACDLLLASELFGMHSQRSTDRIVEDAKGNTDPHAELILLRILLHYGCRHPSFFRSLRKWSPLLPFLMDHIMIDVDSTSANTWAGSAAGMMGLGVPVEVRLQTISVILLYEVCRVQKIDVADLRLFTEDYINRLFDLVEDTRNNADETLNYSLIKLIVALNEQFMVASLPQPNRQSPTHSHPPHPLHAPTPVHHHAKHHSHSKSGSGRESPPVIQNRVLIVLMRRLGHSKTFGENLIFMLNRADNTPEDLCMQLLVLKLLYLLFTTHGTQEYFYTNDLRVLVDVFIRELVDLPDESESLRHTYLRVLHPLLTNTQLRSHPYKRLQIRNVLDSLTAHANIRDVSSTTRRLVDRCLRGAWCKALDAELESLSMKRGETQSEDSRLKPKSSMLGSDDGSRTSGKTLHKSASMNFAGQTMGLSRRPSKGGAGVVPKISGDEVPDGDHAFNGRVPRSADAASGSASFGSQLTERRSNSEEPGPSASLRLPDIASLSVADSRNDSTSSLHAVTAGAASSSVQASDGRVAAIAVTAPTPVERSPAITPIRSQSPATGEVKRGGKEKTLPPPPPLRKRRSSDAVALGSTGRHAKEVEQLERDTPSRTNSVGEVSRSGVNSDERFKPQTSLLNGNAGAAGTTIRRSAPPTPPPKRRKAPAVPTGGRKGVTMTTIASSSSVKVGVEVPVGGWAVLS
ncbi:hypothetical protein FRB99_007674 [Tulasnella sp. 403]|nr:hypothetical protein FRB99_007674 [Tulasnella sp. 403]